MREDRKIRNIELRISDQDMKTLAGRCGSCGISIQELLETFIGDLTGGQGYSGSDEGELADQWLDRHIWTVGDESLLQWLMSYGGGVRDIETIITAWDEKKLYEADPDKYEADLGGDLDKWWDEDIQDTTDGYKGALNDAEVDKLREWLKDREAV